MNTAECRSHMCEARGSVVKGRNGGNCLKLGHKASMTELCSVWCITALNFLFSISIKCVYFQLPGLMCVENAFVYDLRANILVLIASQKEKQTLSWHANKPSFIWTSISPTLSFWYDLPSQVRLSRTILPAIWEQLWKRVSSVSADLSNAHHQKHTETMNRLSRRS